MAKSKNHSNHNQAYKAHRNGLRKPSRVRWISTKGVRQSRAPNKPFATGPRLGCRGARSPDAQPLGGSRSRQHAGRRAQRWLHVVADRCRLQRQGWLLRAAAALAGWGLWRCASTALFFLPPSAVTAPGVPLTALLPAQMDPKFLRNQRKAKRKQDALKKSGVITKKITFFPKAPQA